MRCFVDEIAGEGTQDHYSALTTPTCRLVQAHVWVTELSVHIDVTNVDNVIPSDANAHAAKTRVPKSGANGL